MIAGKEDNTMDHNIRINGLPAKTWNHMEINDAPVQWEPGMPLTPVFQQGTGFRTDGAPKIPTGAGSAADEIFTNGPIWAVEAAAGETKEELVNLSAEQGTQGTAVLRLIAGAGSHLTVYTHMRGGENSQAAVRLLLQVEKDAVLRLVELLEPGQGGRMLHDVGGVCGENAQVALLHLYLGRGDLYSGCRMELIGSGSGLRYEAGYLEQNAQKLDVNLIANHIGAHTTSQIRADGTLKDSGEKTFRGTIDFKRGAKGAAGSEQENVLLLGEHVVNKTIPLILCAEEDVQGDHGATIGELDEETLFYFAARGIAPLEAENLLSRAKLERLGEAMGREDMVEAARAAIEEVLG